MFILMASVTRILLLVSRSILYLSHYLVPCHTQNEPIQEPSSRLQTCRVMKTTWNREISSAWSTDHKINVLSFLRAYQSQNWTFSSFIPCPSLPSVATDDRKQFQCLDTVLNKKKLDYYFRNSVAKTRCSFLQDSKLLVCTWRHNGHVGGPKHFSPLETKPYFHVNLGKKKLYCIDHHHGRLITWLQAKNQPDMAR